MNSEIRITLIEDNVDYRSALKMALEHSPGIRLVSEFGTSEIAIRSLDQASGEEIPDLVLLDLRLPGTDGLDAISLIMECVPNAKILILTQSNQEEDVLRGISLGASGYLLKTATVDEITDGIRTVMNGGAALESGVAKFILESLQTRLPSKSNDRFLSQRELEILKLVAKGMVKKEIAKQLQIGYSTVDTHVGRIYAKLNVSNAPAAVNKAHKMRILRPDDEQ